MTAPDDDLFEELNAFRASVTPGRTWRDSEFSALVPALPLFHRLGRPLADPERPRLEIAESKPARAVRGIDHCSFSSVGYAVFFDPPIVLAFGPMDEVRSHRLSAPWDTGGVGALMKWGAAYHADRVARYSLPGGPDERFLAHYLATLFDTPSSFLVGAPPTGKDVLGVVQAALGRSMEGHHGYTTPEARFTAAIDLDDDVLLAAFVDVDALHARPEADAWKRTTRALRQRLGRERFFPLRRGHGAVDLRGEASRFVSGFIHVELGARSI